MRDITSAESLTCEKDMHIFELLVHEAAYAIRSNNENLVYECLGSLRMARRLGAITKEENRRIEKALIPGWINNVAHREELAKTITEEEIGWK